jgi:hypothetical protein
MSELGPESRALLDAARGADEPASADRDRVRARVAAAIAAGAGASAGEGAASAGSAGGSIAAGGLVVKLALAILAVGAIATGAFFAFRGGDDDAPPADEPVAAVEPAAEPEPAPAPEAAPVAEPEPEVVVDPEPAKKKPVKKPAERPPSADSLKEERAILARASAALRGGDADGALAAVAEHAKKFPKGLLVEERSATKVLGLCAAGKVAQGEKARDAFLDRWPRSVHAARVQAACR